MIQERKTWSLQEEILEAFETALNLSYSDLKQEPMIYSYKGKNGRYESYTLILIFVRSYFLWYVTYAFSFFFLILTAEMTCGFVLN